MGSLGDDYPFEFTWIDLQTKQPLSNEFIFAEIKKLPEDKFDKKYRRRFEQLIGASRFITKIWNAYRFLYLNLKKIKIADIKINPKDLSAIDSYFFSEFNKNLDLITNYFDGYNWHGATMILRTFFWNEICDNYIEAIKYKFYSEDKQTRESSLKNTLNLFYKLLIISSVIMPFITEEIYSIIFKKFKDLKSIHIENWPKPYENISEELAGRGKLGIEIIKFLRMYKSKLQLPLNQEISKVLILTEENQILDFKNLKEDIQNTIRIDDLEIFNKSMEDSIKEKPDLKQEIEELNILVYIFK
jgi:valyl-tRNA synthetase